MPFRIKKWDRILGIALVLCLAFSLFGINWGRVESWNVDQVAMRDPFKEDGFTLHPGKFDKPPFHTYFNLVLSLGPLKGIQKAFGLSDYFFFSAILIWCRFLTVLLFLGSVVLVYKICERAFGIHAARILSLLFATSAGLISYAHFLTADIPVMFWMLVACYFAQNILLGGGLRDYLGSGFFTGIATATKYNGLAVGIAIVVAYALVSGKFNWKNRDWWKGFFLNKRPYLGVLVVIGGFLAGNPYALIDSSGFISDFVYNYKVTPVYTGVLEGQSYGVFIQYISQLIGYPLLTITLLSLPLSVYYAFSSKSPFVGRCSWILFLSVFLLYYIKFGAFPRQEVRFVLPIVPYFILLSGPFWVALSRRFRTSVVLVSALLIYNVICSFYVGKRFNEDPRTAAQNWVLKNVSANQSIESSHYSPNFSMLRGAGFHSTRMANISGRGRFFRQLFKNDSQVVDKLESRETDESGDWYTREGLESRNPDFVAINDRYYSRFFSEAVGTLYPQIKRFFTELLDEEYGYQIVFDQQSRDHPGWIYPDKIDFLENRMIIFEKKDG